MRTFQKNSSRASVVPRRGAMLPLIALLLPLIIMFLGFAVDMAYMQNVRMEMRATTDSAARAAANTLARTDKISKARRKAKTIAFKNPVAGIPLEIETSDIIFGRSEPDANGRFVFKPNKKPANAVQITGSRLNSSVAGGVPLFFGGFLGVSTFEPRQTATATFLNVDICLVLDQSTSMKHDVGSDETLMYTTDPRYCKAPGLLTRWMALDQAIHVFTTALRSSNAEELVSVVTYSSSQAADGFTYCGGTNAASKLELSLDKKLNAIDSTIEDLSMSIWNGNTNIEAGMRTGLAELESGNARKFSDKLMIVFTDGNETTGSSVDAAIDCAAANIVVHTVTFGDFANQAAMLKVAAAGHGEHHHATNAQELEDVFRELAAWVARLTQ